MEMAARKSPSSAQMGIDGIDPDHWRALTVWVQQLVKTLKTCRLYDGENPTVIRFREELAAQFKYALQKHGSFRITFSSDDVCWEGRSLYPARSRDDNLAHSFFRDGIRSLTFHPGIEGAEVETFVDLVLRVTGPRAADEDLVTLLWSAHLPHLDMDYVPIDGDIDGGGTAEREKLLELIPPWPSAGESTPPPRSHSQMIPGGILSTETTGDSGRSDDWETREGKADPLKLFGLLELRQDFETDRFRWESEAEQGCSSIRSALDLINDCLRIDGTDESRQDLILFLPRVLREAILQAAWDDAREAIELLDNGGSHGWSAATLAGELLGPYSVVTPKAVIALDRQDTKGVESFLEFARRMGTGGVEWLMTVLAESQQKRVRRPLTKIIAEIAAEEPERLEGWLKDSRWYVVRNVVHIMGWIGGPKVVPLLGKALNHPEPRVRQEIVATLAQAEPGVARTLLLNMLEEAPSRLFGAILHQLSQERDPTVSRRLLDYMLSPAFENRPVEDSRALYMALGRCGGNEILPALEEGLNKGAWLTLKPDVHHRATARCLARIGTPEALEVLQRGSRSHRPAVRKACQEAMSGVGDG